MSHALTEMWDRVFQKKIESSRLRKIIREKVSRKGQKDINDCQLRNNMCKCPELRKNIE